MADKEYHPTAMALRRASDRCEALEGELPDDETMPEFDEVAQELEAAESKMNRAFEAWEEAGSPELPAPEPVGGRT